MKMKEACRSTLLTEKAIRLYLSKGLLAPRRIRGIIDFDAGDIRALKDIAALRKRGFSIEQITGMLRDAAVIPAMIGARIEDARRAAAAEQETLDALGKLQSIPFRSAGDFVGQLEAQNLPPQEPRFARFDDEDEKTLRPQIEAAARELPKRERLRRRLRVCAVFAGVLLAAGIAAAMFLNHIRIDGFLPLSPCTVIDMSSRDPLTFDAHRITLSVDSEWAREIIGKDVLTLSAVAIRPVEKGQTLDGGVQLALEITNLELLRMGISPFQSFRTQSEAVNSAWLKTILNAYFKRDDLEAAKVWIGDISNKSPLF